MPNDCYYLRIWHDKDEYRAHRLCPRGYVHRDRLVFDDNEGMDNDDLTANKRATSEDSSGVFLHAGHHYEDDESDHYGDDEDCCGGLQANGMQE